jgi:acetyltransferase-like isoleucine patch superfamily enzyme
MNPIKELLYRIRGEYTTEKLISMGMTVGNNFRRLHGVILDPGHCWLIEIGNNVTMAPRVHILCHDASTKQFLNYTKIGRVTIGDNVFILDDTRIYVVDGSKVTIGEQCMFSDHIEIRTTDNHSIYDRTTGLRFNYEKDVVLEPQVWLGMHTIILKGTFLAKGTIVGAGSLVSGRHDTPNSIIAGHPAKLLRSNVAWTMERNDRIVLKEQS